MLLPEHERELECGADPSCGFLARCEDRRPVIAVQTHLDAQMPWSEACEHRDLTIRGQGAGAVGAEAERRHLGARGRCDREPDGAWREGRERNVEWRHDE